MLLKLICTDVMVQKVHYIYLVKLIMALELVPVLHIHFDAIVFAYV